MGSKITNRSDSEIADKATGKGEGVHTDVLERIALVAKRRTNEPMSRIVDRCQQGDPEAFRQLVEKHISGVHRHLTLLVGPGPEVDDLVQLVFLNVFQSIRRFRGRSAFSTWLFRITVNVARQEIRMRKRRRKLGAAVHEAGKVIAGSCEKTPERDLATWSEIQAVLDRLSMKKRVTYLLYMYEGRSLEEIATLLGTSVSTIGSRLQAARREIVDILKEDRK